MTTFIDSYHASAPTDPYDVTWAHSMWASDPLWLNAGNPWADGDLVAAWRNASGGGDPAAAGAARATYRSAPAGYNGKPALQFAGAQVLDVNIVDVAQTFSVVVIGNTNGTGTGAERLIGNGVSSTAALGDSGAGRFVAAFSTALTSGAGNPTNAAPHLFRGYANGGSSVLAVDGTVLASGAGGANVLSRLTIGAASDSVPNFSSFLVGHVAFYGVAAGDVTADAGWSDFKNFARSSYGLTIA